MGVLGTKNTFSNRFSVQCGGTLLDQTTVLTAAHCFDQAGGPNVVRLGDHDINTSSDGAQAVDVSIRRIIQHPGWDSNSLENDIAILKLSQPIQDSRDIRRACLPTQYRGQDLPSVLARPQPIVVGWGSTSTGTGPTNRLRQAPVQMVTQQQCASGLSSSEQSDNRCDQAVCRGGHQGHLQWRLWRRPLLKKPWRRICSGWGDQLWSRVRPRRLSGSLHKGG